MNPKENDLHAFFGIFPTNKQRVKRVFLVFASITLLLPLMLEHNVDITAQVIVQSRKVSQGDATTSLNRQSASFIPPSLTDIETASDILRSPALIRQTIHQLRDKGEYSPPASVFNTWVMLPIKHWVTDPLRATLIRPIGDLLGLQVDSVRDTALDALTQEAADALKVETMPGSNVICITYDFPDPAQGSLFVAALLQNYLDSRQDLQAIDTTHGLTW